MPFPKAIIQLISTLGRLPGVGPKTAERYAFAVLKMPRHEREALARAITQADTTLTACATCHNYAETNPCSICRDESRDHGLLCIVATEREVQAVEQTGMFKGVYHILGGLLSPALGITPADLTLRELLARVQDGSFREIILALDPTIEGETTTLFVLNTLAPTGVSLTRLARGLPRGAEVSYADEVTLSDALAGRKQVEMPKMGFASAMSRGVDEQQKTASSDAVASASTEENPF
jgi:recombination protein RecR